METPDADESLMAAGIDPAAIDAPSLRQPEQDPAPNIRSHPEDA